MEVLDIILPIVYIVVGIALVWFVVELAITLIKVRKKAIKTIDDLQPTLENVQTMVTDLQPTIKKVDPLMERVTLTVDSVNLEILRVDEILEDVSQITNTVTNTMDTVNTVTSAPMDMVTSVTKKVREKFRPKAASTESVQAGLNAGEDDERTNPIVDFADAAVDAAGEAYKEQRARNQVRKEEKAARIAKEEAKSEELSNSSDRLADSILDQLNDDTTLEANGTSVINPDPGVVADKTIDDSTDPHFYDNAYDNEMRSAGA